MPDPSIVLFDGVCNLCNHSVHFIIDRDPHQQFRFASLQSDHGRQLLEHHGLPAEQLDSIVLIEAGRAYLRSSAALRIARRLKWPWKIFYLGVVIPRPIRDAIYRWIAANRYRWFGKEETCRIPTPELRSRFLS